MKLKHLKSYDTTDVPDYILEEMNDLSAKMIMAMEPIFAGKSPNIIMGVMNFVHAGMVKMLISEKPGELEKAATITADTLIKNIQHLKNMEEKKEEDGV